MTATLWLVIWMPIGVHAQPATSSARNDNSVLAAKDVAATAKAKDAWDHAVDVSNKALGALNSCFAVYMACTDPCVFAKDVAACVARCGLCTSEENALTVAGREVGLRETTFLQTAQNGFDNFDRAIKAASVPPAPSAPGHAAEAAHLAAEAFHIGTGVAEEILDMDLPLGWGLAGWGGLLMFNPDLFPKVPSTTSLAPPPVDKYNPAWYSPLPDKNGRVAVPPLAGVRLNPSPQSGDPFLNVNPGDVHIVDSSEAASSGTAVFRSGDQSGTAVFQTNTVNGSGTAVFSTQPKPEWSGDGIAVFSPLTPIPESESINQQTLNEPATQPSTSFWRSLLIGVLQQAPAITQAIWGPKQPVALPQPQAKTGQAAVRSSATPGAKTPTPSALTVPSVTMCLNPAAVASTHNVALNGSYVTGPDAPSRNYNALYIPCSQVKK